MCCKEKIMKEKIVVRRAKEGLVFYMNSRKGRIYLFTQRFSKAVYNFFLPGRCEEELKKFHSWNRNPRLDKTIEKLPSYIRYARKYGMDLSEGTY